MTKKRRDIATVFCEREGIIPVPQSCLVLEKYWFGRKFSSSINTNNLLAVEPETENDAGRQDLSVTCFDLASIAPAAHAVTIGYFDSTLERWVPFATTILMVVTPALETKIMPAPNWSLTSFETSLRLQRRLKRQR